MTEEIRNKLIPILYRISMPLINFETKMDYEAIREFNELTSITEEQKDVLLKDPIKSLCSLSNISIHSLLLNYNTKIFEIFKKQIEP